MNEPVHTASLLSLTAPARKSQPVPPAEEGFHDRLDAASSEPATPKRPARGDVRTNEPEPSGAKAAPGEQDPKAPASNEEATAADQQSPASEVEAPPTGEADTREQTHEPSVLLNPLEVEEPMAAAEHASQVETEVAVSSGESPIDGPQVSATPEQVGPDPPNEELPVAGADIAATGEKQSGAQAAAILVADSGQTDGVADEQESQAEQATRQSGDPGLSEEQGESASGLSDKLETEESQPLTGHTPESSTPHEAAAVTAPAAAAQSGATGAKPATGDRKPEPQRSSEAVAEATEVVEHDPHGSTAAEPIINTETSIAADAAAPESAARVDSTAEAQVEPINVDGSGRQRAEQGPSTERAGEQRPVVDPARFVARVARAFEAADRRGGGPVEIRLSPPELGSMQLKLEVRDGALTATIETETQAARNALLDNLPALRERLAEQEIRVEKFDVDVRDEGRQSEAEAERDAARERDREARREARQEESAVAEETTSGTAVRSTIDFGDDRINLVA